MSDWTALRGPLAAWSRGSGPRVVFVHGFTQTAQSWRRIAEALSDDGWECVIVDAPGHGDSATITADLDEAADMLAAQFGPAIYIGYSMGARLCLHVAILHLDVVHGLVSIGGSPGIEDPSERTQRKAADGQLAAHIENVGVERFLDEWLAQPLFAGLVLDDQHRADRLRNTAAGLAASLRHAGAGAQRSLWDQLGTLTMPVLAMAGELDGKYTNIGRRLARAVGDGTFTTIAHAGHAAHLQQPDAVLHELRAFLRRAVRSTAEHQANRQE